MLELLFGGAEDEQGQGQSSLCCREGWERTLIFQRKLCGFGEAETSGGALSFLSLLMCCSSTSTKTVTVYSEFTGACEVSSYKSLMPVLSSPLLNWLPQIPLTALKGKGEHGGNRQAFCSVCCLKASSLTPSHYEVSRTLCFLSYMAFSGSCAETWAGLGTSRGLLFCFWEENDLESSGS